MIHFFLVNYRVLNNTDKRVRILIDTSYWFDFSEKFYTSTSLSPFSFLPTFVYSFPIFSTYPFPRLFCASTV